MRMVDGVRRLEAEPNVVLATSGALRVPTAFPSLRQPIDGVRRVTQTAMPDIRPEFAGLLPTAITGAALPQAALRARRDWKSAIAFGLILPVIAASAGLTVRATVGELRTQVQSASRTAAVQTLPPTPSAAALASAAATVKESVDLQNIVNTFVGTKVGSENYGIVVKDLSTGATTSSGADTIMNSASLYKLYVAQRILAGIDRGQYSFNQPANDVLGRNVQSCLYYMITISDNNCGVALGALLGWGDRQNAALNTLGFTHTDLNTLQKTSASDVALYLEKLYNGSLLSTQSTNYLMGLLKAQKVNNRLPVGLPAGVTIAHKTGDLWDSVHDAGIVYGPNGHNYLVVMMSNNWSNVGAAPARFAGLSRQIYARISQ